MMSSLHSTLKRVLCEQPLTFLDPVFYTSTDLPSLEQENIFSKTWLYACHISRVSEPGSAIVIEAAGRSLIVMRSLAGELAAFHNSCSHRGAALLGANQPVSSTKCLVCPYHGWTFDTAGNLKGLPEKKRFATTVDFSKLKLKPVQLDTWGPLIFVSLDKQPQPLSNFLGEAVIRMAGFPMEQLIPLFSDVYDVACNWKTFHDNGLCDYHVSIAHQNTLKDVQGSTKYYSYVFDDYINALITPTTDIWKSENDIWDALTGEWRSQFVTFGIFPNLHVYALPDGTLYVERIDPISVHTCRVHTEVYGLPRHLGSVDELKRWYDELFEEDRQLTEAVQRGYMSIRQEHGYNSYTPGPINSLEGRIVHQQQLIRRHLLTGMPTDMATPIGSGYSDSFERSRVFQSVNLRNFPDRT